MKFNFKIIFFLLFFLFIGVGVFIYNKNEETKLEKQILDAKLDMLLTGEKKSIDKIEEEEEINNPENSKSVTKNLPESANLGADFISQSPFGTWGSIFGETCEEASALIAINYVRGIKMTKNEFRNSLLEIVSWEKINFGKFEHTSVKETAYILSNYFSFNEWKIKKNPTLKYIKQNIFDGHIVIAPFYGVGLNPYYSNGGPEYHFMVIKGYDKNNFIVHDVGTKQGADYLYPQEIIMDRIHDYHSEDIQKGDKKIIVVQKNK